MKNIKVTMYLCQTAMSDCRITGWVEVALGRIIKSPLYENNEKSRRTLAGEL